MGSRNGNAKGGEDGVDRDQMSEMSPTAGY